MINRRLLLFAPLLPALAKEKKPKMVRIAFFNDAGEPTGVQEVPKVVKSDEEWRKQLSEDSYTVARSKGTEPPFCGKFTEFHGDGIYKCICCFTPLFDSRAKYNSKSGWASFKAPIAKQNIRIQSDYSHGMVRDEVLCTRCDAHLGHVFDDGPPPTNQRYCMNSVSFLFVERKQA